MSDLDDCERAPTFTANVPVHERIWNMCENFDLLKLMSIVQQFSSQCKLHKNTREKSISTLYSLESEKHVRSHDAFLMLRKNSLKNHYIRHLLITVTILTWMELNFNIIFNLKILVSPLVVSTDFTILLRFKSCVHIRYINWHYLCKFCF